MNRWQGRGSACRTALALVATSLVALLPTAAGVRAGTQTNVNACRSSVNGLYSDVVVTAAGTAAAPSSSQIALTAVSVEIVLPEAVYLELYSLGYYSAGFNSAGVSATMTIAGSNTLEPQQSLTGTTSVQVQITDPDGVKGTGDESAVASPPILVPFAPTVWTPTGGEIQFTQSALQITTSHFFGVALANLDCVPGSTPDRTSLVPAAPVPFETIMPPALPTCADTSVISGPGLTVEVDAVALCVDANDDLDPASLSIVSGPTAGTASTSPLGILTYTNSDGGVGSDQVVLTITDASGLVSPPFTVSIVVQSLRYIEQIGPLVALSPVTLDGGSAVATGDLNSITVTNVPVSGLGFTVSGYATDLAAPGVPTMAVDTNGDGVSDLVVPDCAGERRCIPASNLGWAPSAEVVIDGVDGGGAAVLPGPTDAASAQDWLSQLGAETPGPGLSQPEILCSSQPGVAHGTFRCDAGLFLGVPASAAEASYTGLIVITII